MFKRIFDRLLEKGKILVPEEINEVLKDWDKNYKPTTWKEHLDKKKVYVYLTDMGKIVAAGELALRMKEEKRTTDIIDKVLKDAKWAYMDKESHEDKDGVS